MVSIHKDLNEWDGGDAGVMYATAALFDGLRKAAEVGLYGLSDGIAKLAEEGRVQAIDVTGNWWLDLDTYDDMRLAQDYLAEQDRLTA